MPYIGKSPTGTGVRSRYHFTATGGETSLSGADDNNRTLVFSDGEYVDVYLNGILLFDGDYNTTTSNTVGGLTALTASDVVEIVVYDIFTVADTVSAKNGGTFNGNVDVTGTVTATSFSGDGSSLTGINTDLVSDTTPQLGGNLDAQTNDITNVGAIGIGATSPDRPLHIKTSLQPLIKFEDTDGDGDYSMIGGDTVGNLILYADHGNGGASTRIRFFVDGSEKARIDSLGNLLMDGEGGSNVTVNARAGSAKAWCFWQQSGTQTVRDSYNISSIADDGTGETYIYYNNDFNNAESSCNGTSNWNGVFTHDVYNAGYHLIRGRGASSTSLQDRGRLSCATHGDLA